MEVLKVITLIGLALTFIAGFVRAMKNKASWSEVVTGVCATAGIVYVLNN